MMIKLLIAVFGIHWKSPNLFKNNSPATQTIIISKCPLEKLNSIKGNFMTQHAPSNYQTTIAINFQELMEVRKAITDRILKLFFSNDDEHQYREQDIETLNNFLKTLETHIAIASEQWETDVVRAEVSELNDNEAVKQFLNGDFT